MVWFDDDDDDDGDGDGDDDDLILFDDEDDDNDDLILFDDEDDDLIWFYFIWQQHPLMLEIPMIGKNAYLMIFFSY